MNNILTDFNNIRFEISFKSYDELRHILSFYQKNDLYKINIPCKKNLKRDFLLNSIKICREEFPDIDIIPHFSILHEFRRNSNNTKNYFFEFIQVIIYLGCKEVLLVSGSQKRATLDSISALYSYKSNTQFSNKDFSVGIAFNPYLPSLEFEAEIIRLEKKLKSGLVTSIWIQFGTDVKLLERRLEILKTTILSTVKINSDKLDIELFGSILIPSKQFLSRFKYRPWKGVFCSSEFLESVELATNLVSKLLKCYNHNKICPIIETNITTNDQLKSMRNLFYS